MHPHIEWPVILNNCVCLCSIKLKSIDHVFKLVVSRSTVLLSPELMVRQQTLCWSRKVKSDLEEMYKDVASGKVTIPDLDRTIDFSNNEAL